MIRILLVLLIAAIPVLTASAGPADVLSADIQRDADGTYTISVEVEHDDDGWDHYADAWDVLGPDGDILATRKLAHPHVNEQPFIRSKSGIAIPENIAEVTIRAHDLEHGYGGKTLTVTVPRQ